MKPLSSILLAAFVLSAGALQAQEPMRAPDGGTTQHVDGVELLPLSGMPLTGKSNIEWTRTLEDGSTVTVHLLANLARDGAGRMYRERRTFVPVHSNDESRLKDILLFDPSARTKTTCALETKKCLISTWLPRRQFALQPTGPFDHNTRSLSRDSLGDDTVNGISVTGSRETVTIQPGTVGNDKALITTREFWYAPSIHTNLLVMRNDPREGKQTIALIDLSLAEPDPRLFEIPAGYAVVDERTGDQFRK